MSDLVPVVPVYSRYSISAVSKSWKGTLVTDRVTADNTWSLLAMEPADGPMKPLYLVQQDEPRALNPFTSSTAYDWQIMGLIYDSLIAVDPYTLETIPWLAGSWAVETEKGPSGPRTVLTFRLRKGWSGTTAVPLLPQTRPSPTTLKKSAPPRYLDNVENIDYVETPDDRTLKVTMKNVSFWHLHRVAGTPSSEAHCGKSEGLEELAPGGGKGRPRADRPRGDRTLRLQGVQAGEYVRMSGNERFWLGRGK